MRAEIKSYNSPDIFDLQNYIPEKPGDFGFLLQVIVGPKGEEGEESFDFEVCTPKWLAQKYKKEDIVFARFIILVFEYNFDRILQRITKLVNSVEGKNWTEVATKIARYGHWEFEDYQY